MPTLASMCYKYSIGQPFIYPRNDLDYASNFLHMMFANPCEEYNVNPVVARAMDKIFTLHADDDKCLDINRRLAAHQARIHLLVLLQVLHYGACSWRC